MLELTVLCNLGRDAYGGTPPFLLVLCLTTIGGLSGLYPPHNAIAHYTGRVAYGDTPPLLLVCLTIIGGTTGKGGVPP